MTHIWNLNSNFENRFQNNKYHSKKSSTIVDSWALMYGWAKYPPNEDGGVGAVSLEAAGGTYVTVGVGAANEIVVPPGKTVVGADSFYKNMNTQLTLTLMLFETHQKSKPFPCFNACGKKNQPQ